MQDRQRESSVDSHIENPVNVVSFKEAIERKYNPQAAFYALPKAFINRLLIQLSGNTLKVFLALVNHTDCWNVIKYPDKITYSALMKTTGIKKKDTISKAYRDLCSLNIIGGYVPGHGSNSTGFYFTFDIDHYKTEECCLQLEEISPYYEMLLSGKYTNPDPGAGEGSPKKRDTQDKIDILINNAGKDLKFKHEFNEFCTRDTSKYLKDTLFWIAKNAVEFGLSLGEVIDSLSAANDKDRQGSMSYLIGIMRNKSRNKAGGLKVITRPLLVQVKQYFQERFSHCLDYLESYDFNIELNQLQYKLKNPQADKDSMDEFFMFVVDDIKRAVGVSLSAVEIA
ncbi:MAG: hypothetical protein JXN64_12740 [Spirochaetes bacterium]|nr:hypothetical protein [Spirochaetota bacterium]